MAIIPFQTINWDLIEPTEHIGETGTSIWRTLQFDGLRIRMVKYSAGYFANHWCEKGHIVHCLEGSFISQLQTGEQFLLKEGETYIVSDEMSSHRSVSENGVSLLIIDGDFLKHGKLSLRFPEKHENPKRTDDREYPNEQ